MMAGIFTHHAHNKQFRNSCYFEIVNIYAMILAIRTGIDFHEFHAAEPTYMVLLMKHSDKTFLYYLVFFKKKALK